MNTLSYNNTHFLNILNKNLGFDFVFFFIFYLFEDNKQYYFYFFTWQSIGLT